MKKKLVIMLIVSLGIVGLSGCNGGTSNNTIKITGSTTIQGLIGKMGKAFKVKTGVHVDVAGGGSGRGINDVLLNRNDIGNASRDIKKKEIKKAQAKQVKIKRIKVAIDGICIVLNKSITGIDTLDIAQIKSIFTGQITNWKELGGPDMNIVLFIRDKHSGTGEFFKKRVVGKKTKIAGTAQQTESNSDMALRVSDNPGAIGYAGYGFVEQVRDKVVIVKVSDKKKNVAATEPTLSTISDMSYPISRYVYQFVRADKFKGKIKQFIDFVLANKEIVKREAFIPIQDASTAIDDVY